MKQFLIKFCLALLAVFAPIKTILLGALVLILADLITGVWAAKVRKEAITSAGLRRTIGKLFVYESSICLAYIAQHYVMQDAIEIIKVLTTFIALVEIKSLLENIDVIYGTPLLKVVIDKINSKGP